MTLRVEAATKVLLQQMQLVHASEKPKLENNMLSSAKAVAGPVKAKIQEQAIMLSQQKSESAKSLSDISDKLELMQQRRDMVWGGVDCNYEMDPVGESVNKPLEIDRLNPIFLLAQQKTEESKYNETSVQKRCAAQIAALNASIDAQVKHAVHWE
jgi:hypothetical protein